VLPGTQIRPDKGVIAKFVYSLGYQDLECEIRRKRETPPRWWRLIVYFYFQCSELGRAMWQISEVFPEAGVTVSSMTVVRQGAS
jgi:hypothetical protein